MNCIGIYNPYPNLKVVLRFAERLIQHHSLCEVSVHFALCLPTNWPSALADARIFGSCSDAYVYRVVKLIVLVVCFLGLLSNNTHSSVVFACVNDCLYTLKGHRPALKAARLSACAPVGANRDVCREPSKIRLHQYTGGFITHRITWKYRIAHIRSLTESQRVLRKMGTACADRYARSSLPYSVCASQ